MMGGGCSYQDDVGGGLCKCFRLLNIADKQSRFFNCHHALPEATVSLITNLVEVDPLPQNPYTELRHCLLAAHQLTDIQRVEQLHNLPPLAAQKLSKLLAEMLRLCPKGQKNNAFFNCLFLNKLPRELRIFLLEAEKQALAARADLFATHSSKQPHGIVAVVAAVSSPEQEGEETTVAAIRPGARSGQCGCRQRGGSWRGKKKQGCGGGGDSRQQVSLTLTHAEQARIGSGLCFNHF
jgi:hypothetical protein